MPVITISRGSYSKGKAIAEKLAQKLGYECISREILLEASEHFNISEIKLRRALHDAPSILERFTYGKVKYIAFIRRILLEHIQRDNIVYHGLAGQFFLQEISHVIKVRIIANFQDRVKEEMQRENVSEKAALGILKKDDNERRKWSLYLYGIDTADASLYDVVLHVDNLKVDDAVDILVDLARRPCFQTTSESKKIVDNLVLAAKCKAALVDKFPNIEVTNKGGIIYLDFQGPLSYEDRTATQATEVKDLLRGIDGIKAVRSNLIQEALLK
jgi:cytidylate kinase